MPKYLSPYVFLGSLKTHTDAWRHTPFSMKYTDALTIKTHTHTCRHAEASANPLRDLLKAIANTAGAYWGVPILADDKEGRMEE